MKVLSATMESREEVPSTESSISPVIEIFCVACCRLINFLVNGRRVLKVESSFTGFLVWSSGVGQGCCLAESMSCLVEFGYFI